MLSTQSDESFPIFYMKKEVDYFHPTGTSEDKIRVYFKKYRGKIAKFIIQYLGLINSRWRSIMRVDTCHGYAHIHTYHLAKKESVVKLSSNPEGNNKLFTIYKGYIIKNFKKIKDNFIFSK